MSTTTSSPSPPSSSVLILPSPQTIQQYQTTLRSFLRSSSSSDPEKLIDLCQVILSWKMNSSLLSQTKLFKDVKNLIRKLSSSSSSFSESPVLTQTKALYQQWNRIYLHQHQDDESCIVPRYSQMNLEDFLEVDLPKPPFTDRVYLPQNQNRDTRIQRQLEKRIHILKGPSAELPPASSTPSPVVYWMSRDQRLHDNWALLYAQQRALETNSPLCIIFCLTSNFPQANIRSYGFMLRGLKLLQLDCENYSLPFYLLKGSPEQIIPRFCSENSVKTLITDFSPLFISKQWKQQISSQTPDDLLFLEVDTHNICPVRKVSNKCEFAAKTIRTKIHAQVSEYLTEFPAVQVMNESLARSHRWISPDISASRSLDSNGTSNHPECFGNLDIWESIMEHIQEVDRSVPEVTWLESGEHAAMESLKEFLGIHLDGYSSSNRHTSRLDTFATNRNDPTIANGCSGLSPYLHFGQLSSQRICLELKRVKKFNTINAMFPPGERTTSVHSFCEELVVRKELSDNFCFYNDSYMTIGGAHSWAQTTLQEHWNDTREVIYSQEQLETAQTGDNLWNSAQLEMVKTGKMHGFMRMYWAKKILEWTPNPDEALRIAIYLNDKYSLDGRDPNGYVGCMWAIAGVHDRAWGPERNVFGKIRFMNYEGCKRKFEIKKYIAVHGPPGAAEAMAPARKRKK